MTNGPALPSVDAAAMTGTAVRPVRWLFSAPIDLAAFLGSAAVSLAALWVGSLLGVLHHDSPEWTWVTFVLLLDVAHVWSTGFRVYFDPAELHRRPWLYGLTPVIAWLVGFALYSEGEQLFWRTLAYLAVFHFVRQQYGWVALYRARNNEQGRAGAIIDASAIYLATVYPLVYWHTHLPRAFHWFLAGDFVPLKLPLLCQITEFAYWTALTLYVLRSNYRGVVLREFNPGKDVVLVTTAVCWYIGIVHFDSDYAFTVTNVIIHGFPYLVLVYWYRFHRSRDDLSARSQLPRIAMFIATVWLFAYIEELFWSRGYHHHHGWLFGETELPDMRRVLVPLLAVPQITHYVLDGFIWRRRSNPDLQEAIPAKSRPKD